MLDAYIKWMIPTHSGQHFGQQLGWHLRQVQPSQTQLLEPSLVIFPGLVST